MTDLAGRRALVRRAAGFSALPANVAMIVKPRAVLLLVTARLLLAAPAPPPWLPPPLRTEPALVRTPTGDGAC